MTVLQLFGTRVDRARAETQQANSQRTRGGGMIIEGLVVAVIILWLMGVVFGQTFGGLLHALLIVAAIVFLFRLVSGRTVA